MNRRMSLPLLIFVLPFILIACKSESMVDYNHNNEALAISTTGDIQEDLSTEISPLPTDASDNTSSLTDELKEKIVGKWLTKFYAWDRYGREDWYPEVLDNQIVIISEDEVTYLDYLIKDPIFYRHDWSIAEQSTFRQFPCEITQFQTNIIDICISAKDSSLYPPYYAIGFFIIGDIALLHYQGAFFEISKQD